MRAKYNWEKLKQEFFESDIEEVFTFIKHKLGTNVAQSGGVKRNIKNWTEEKKEYQRKIMEEAREETKKELIEKMKIKLEDVLTAKKLSYSLLMSYLECYGKLLAGQELSESEQKFMSNLPVSKIDKINKWLHIELGLPTNITELQGAKEKPLFFIELVKEARKIIEDAESTGKNSNTESD